MVHNDASFEEHVQAHQLNLVPLATYHCPNAFVLCDPKAAAVAWSCCHRENATLVSLEFRQGSTFSMTLTDVRTELRVGTS